MSDYEWMPVIHSACGGQGCRSCDYSGEQTVRVNVEEVAA